MCDATLPYVHEQITMCECQSVRKRSETKKKKKKTEQNNKY